MGRVIDSPACAFQLPVVYAATVSVEQRLECCGITVAGKHDKLVVGKNDVVAYLHIPGVRLNLRSMDIHAS